MSAHPNLGFDWPVATGELESTRWAFADLLARKAADILQPDATVVGGVGEWLRVAHMAAAFDIPIAPHYNWDIHTQLVASIPNGLFIEYFVRGSDVSVINLQRRSSRYYQRPDQDYVRGLIEEFRVSLGHVKAAEGGGRSWRRQQAGHNDECFAGCEAAE